MRLAAILADPRKRVRRYGRSLLEGDAVPASICRRFRSAPDEDETVDLERLVVSSHERHSTAICRSARTRSRR
jgi:hypothetical protein